MILMARMDPFAPPKTPPVAKMQRLLLDSSPDYGLQGKAQQVRPIGDTSSMPQRVASSPGSEYRERCQRLQHVEDDKDTLINDLIRQVESAQQQLGQLRFDYERETRFKREGHLREDALRAELASIRNLISRDPYVAVLIDGDKVAFSRELWKRGETGAAQVVETLNRDIKAYAGQNLPHLSPFRVQVRIFADFQRLSDMLLKSKAIDSMSTFDSFVRGVNSHLTYDFVDTGPYTGLARQKLVENFQQQLRNCHCHQMILGISAHEDYDGLFRFSNDVVLSDRVTLLKTQASRPYEGTRYGLPSLRVDGLFHHESHETDYLSPAPTLTSSSGLSRAESNASSKSAYSGSTPNTPGFPWAAMTAQAFVPQALSANTLSNTTRTSTPTSTSASRKSPSLRRTSTSSNTEIPRNRFGQRIDAIDNTIPYQELQRIKKMKLCNLHYLQGSSACSGNCGHSHAYPLKAHEQSILREVARMTPCFYKLDCSDPHCIYGHRCPQSKPGQTGCYYEDKCRFGGWGHGIDDTVVKTTNVRG